MENENSNAIATTSETAVATTDNTAVANFPGTREQLEILKELIALEQRVEGGFEGGISPTDLAAAGVVFDIIDAYCFDYTDSDGEVQPKVVFQIQEQGTGLVHNVMQSLDRAGIRKTYADLFSTYKALGTPHAPLVGYHYVQAEKGGKAGNLPMILKKVRPQIAKVVSKGK